MNDSSLGSLVRRNIIFITIIGLFAILAFKLFKMQILDKPVYEEKSNENSIKKIVQDAPRGIFFDRNFNILVSNKPSYTVQITPSEFDTSLKSILEKVLELEEGHIDKILYQYRRFSKFHPRKIKRDVKLKNVAWIEENKSDLPGIDYVVEMQRDYSFGVSASHVFGYTKEITAAQLNKGREIYDIGDYIGYNGIERTYEKYLRGTKGSKFVLVDSKQRTIGSYLEGSNNQQSQKGYDLVLSIDAATQKAAEEAFEGFTGAVVAIEPKSGEVIAFVSAPDYSLDAFSAVTSQDVWASLRKDPSKPLFNRATMSINPPGSTHKMLTSIAALEEGIISTSDHITCKGGYQYGNRFFKCLHVHGKTNIIKAIEESCNTYYYQLILKLGLEKWAEYSRMFGFGEKTGIDISEENGGIQPDTEYYNKVYGKGKWTKGLLLNLGIGQGEMSVTPIQLAKYISLIANNGKSKVPHIVRGFIKGGSNEFIPIEYPEINIDISQQTFDIVKEGMFKVVHGEDGTARNIRIRGINVAGKTGTAQNPHGEDHAQFVGFAPFEDPQIVVTVIVENVGYGSTYAAPIAKKVIETYLRQNKKQFGNETLVLNSESDQR